MPSPADWQSPRRKWLTTFLELVDERTGGGPAESHAEVQIERALHAAGVAGLVRQYEVRLSSGRCVRFDFAIPSIKWALKVDLFPTHFETAGSVADACRDVDALDDGWRVRRITKREMAGLAELGARLASEVSTRRRQHRLR